MPRSLVCASLSTDQKAGGSSPSERAHEFPGHRPDASSSAPLPVSFGLILAVLASSAVVSRRSARRSMSPGYEHAARRCGHQDWLDHTAARGRPVLTRTRPVVQVHPDPPCTEADHRPPAASTRSRGHRVEEDLHIICTRSASLLHTRELRFWVTRGQGPQGESLAWFGCACQCLPSESTLVRTLPVSLRSVRGVTSAGARRLSWQEPWRREAYQEELRRLYSTS
jgi:hypothetical protein